LDWAVLAAYGVVIVGLGMWLSRRPPSDAKGYFLAGRAMPTWAVVISILATVQSAATFVAVPESAYAGNLAYLISGLGPILAAIIAATIFIPAYWRAGVSTPYELLERRFGPKSRRATSVMYLVGQTMGTGARMFIGALPVSWAIFGDTEPVHVLGSIAMLLMLAGGLSIVGGLGSAIWIDVVQVMVYIGAAIAAIFVLVDRIDLPIGEIWARLGATTVPTGGTKLSVIDARWPPDLSKPWTIWSACTGVMLLNLAVLTTNQDFVQRSLACSSARQGARSVVLSALVGVPVVMLFLTIGLLLHVFYSLPGVAGTAALPASKDIFPRFMLTESPAGVAGLMIAGVLAVGPAGVNATLNSMASTIVNDLWGRGRRETGEIDPRPGVRIGRWATLASAVFVGGFAMLCVYWYDPAAQPLIDFALNIMSYAYTGLLGVFITALLTRRGSDASALAALIGGALPVAALDRMLPIWPWISPLVGMEGRSIAGTWAMLIGTVVATAICCVSGPARQGGGPSAA
jgi:solute:Na+ symporter, SSS family